MTATATEDQKRAVQTRHHIGRLVNEIEMLCQDDLPPQMFYAEFLPRVVEALAADGGAVWNVDEDGHVELAYQVNLQSTSLCHEGDHQVQHARLVSQVAGRDQGLLVAPHSGMGKDGDAANPTEKLLVLAPLRSESRAEVVVEIFQRPDADLATKRGYLHFLVQMCASASDWLKADKLRQINKQDFLWRQLNEFASSVHDSLDPKLASYTIANEAQRLLACDRVSVAIGHGAKCQVAAVSGQATIERRSNIIAKLQRLVACVVASNEPLWYSGSATELPPQIEDALHEYLDESHTRSIVIVPLACTDRPAEEELNSPSKLNHTPSTVGAIIVEQIEDVQSLEVLRPRIELICDHSACALTHALTHHNLFLMPVWRKLGQARWLVQAKTLPKTVTVSVALVLIMLGLIVVPAQFNLEGKAVLQPVERRDVFTHIDGVVATVAVKHGDLVHKGDVLVTLRNTDLEVRLADMLGQRRSTAEQLAATKRMRHGSQLPPEEKERLAGELLRLTQRHESLDRQYQLLMKKRELLTIRSPIEGQVITWNIQRDLMHRPVSTGQVLLNIADPQGPWELEVFMPENRVGHVSKACQSGSTQRTVDYVVATDPTTTCKGTVREIQSSAQLSQEYGHAVSVLVDIDQHDFHDARPGATATARVNCGRRPLGYVWLHEVFEFVQSKVLFRL